MTKNDERQKHDERQQKNFCKTITSDLLLQKAVLTTTEEHLQNQDDLQQKN